MAYLAKDTRRWLSGDMKGRFLIERGCHGEKGYCRELLRNVTTSSYIPFAVTTRADGLITSEEGSFDFFAKKSGPRHRRHQQQGNRRDDDPGDEDLRPRVDLYRAGNTGKARSSLLMAKGLKRIEARAFDGPFPLALMPLS